MAQITAAMTHGLSVLRRYGAGGPQTLLEQAKTNRNMIRFIASEWQHPRRVASALSSYQQALSRQDVLFTVQRVDDITDATRHANASALVVSRLRNEGASPDVAASFMRRLGQAHEADSELTGVHRAASESMDLHNNELGIAIGSRHEGSEQALEGAVLRALADGRGLVLDSPTSTPRASTAAELLGVLTNRRSLAQ